MVGATAALVFITLNAGSLPEPLAVIVRAAGIVGFITALALVSHRGQGRTPEPGPRPDRHAWRTYWRMVTPELGAPWVALIVGVHFLPFANAFGVPEFRLLAWVMITFAAVGALLALTIDTAFGPVIGGVLSGVALFAFALSSGARRGITSGA
jgi:hypothetical protein